MLTEVEEDLEAPETSSGKAKISTRKYNKYTEEDKVRFFFYHIENQLQRLKWHTLTKGLLKDGQSSIKKIR
jgi:hypothetical protein